MTHSNLNMAQLCRYLHLPESRGKKLVDKGTNPGRRVNGEWVFARDEVNRWLEQRIGESDDAELADVETALQRNESFDGPVQISKLIPEGGIALPLHARTRDSAIRSMVALGMETGLLWDPDALTQAVKQREELHSTALDNGVALLHPRRPMSNIMEDAFIVLGILPSGIPFGGGFDNKTDIFFLICSQDDRGHLRTLARLSRILTWPNFLDRLREAGDAAEIRTLIAEVETEIS